MLAFTFILLAVVTSAVSWSNIYSELLLGDAPKWARTTDDRGKVHKPPYPGIGPKERERGTIGYEP